MATMKAVRIHEFGGPGQLTYEDAPIPTIEEDKVLIRAHAAGVNPVDAFVRAGYMAEYINHSLPLIMGWDVSGVVDQAGSSVTNLKVGDAVYARADVARNGAYGEYVVVHASDVALKPQSLDYIQAGGTPHAALSAWQSLIETAGLSAGQTVLIHGASGGVGSFAVQLAKLRDAHVIGTASERNLDFLRQLGADEVIDYNTTRFEDVVSDVDVVLDLVGGETQQRSWGVLKRGGVLVSLVQPPSHEEAAKHGVKAHMMAIQPHGPQLAEIARAIDAGQIHPVVSTVLPLSEAQQAHKLIETRHTRGKIVLQIVE